jgi:hypothetical protein
VVAAPGAATAGAMGAAASPPPAVPPAGLLAAAAGGAAGASASGGRGGWKEHLPASGDRWCISPPNGDKKAEQRRQIGLVIETWRLPNEKSLATKRQDTLVRMWRALVGSRAG